MILEVPKELIVLVLHPKALSEDKSDVTAALDGNGGTFSSHSKLSALSPKPITNSNVNQVTHKNDNTSCQQNDLAIGYPKFLLKNLY